MTSSSSLREAGHAVSVGEDGQPRTSFDYLLNTADLAGHQDTPADHDYRAKRLALFAYVRTLEALSGAVREEGQ